ncbi:hypothetical protein QL285_007396 [Trifolium repens]|nr:hypothetical protein QL285_007396 [Trifolium repens]
MLIYRVGAQRPQAGALARAHTSQSMLARSAQRYQHGAQRPRQGTTNTRSKQQRLALQEPAPGATGRARPDSCINRVSKAIFINLHLAFKTMVMSTSHQPPCRSTC